MDNFAGGAHLDATNLRERLASRNAGGNVTMRPPGKLLLLAGTALE